MIPPVNVQKNIQGPLAEPLIFTNKGETLISAFALLPAYVAE
jgi:hypothetical protein